jgi:hypothetical protein
MRRAAVARQARVAVIRSRRAASDLGRRRLVLVGLLLLALAALAYVRQASIVAATGYDLQELQEIRQQRLAAVEQLRFKLAEARALDRVAREAEQRGLLPPEQVLYLRLSVAPQPVTSSAPPAAGPASAPSAGGGAAPGTERRP